MSRFHPLEFCSSLVLLLTFIPSILGEFVDTSNANIVIDGTKISAQTDQNFICATIDWWPHTKCNYDQCPWGQASALNLDLSHPLLIKAIKAFKPLRIRLGGSLQDRVLYDFETLKLPCHRFQKFEDDLFGFSTGCLPMNRWDELNHFFKKTGVVLTFGLNALYGKNLVENSTTWDGAWDSSNAYDFINYTVSKGYDIDSWELGNELSGGGVEARIRVEQYAQDLIELRKVIDEIYAKSKVKPSLLAPGGFYEQKWFAKLLQLLQVSGSGVIDTITHHLYDLGPGDDPSLIGKIMSPFYINKTASTFNDLDQTVKSFGSWTSVWVGESGGAYNSGGRNVSDTFIDSFWYLDQLGMSAKYNSKVYCRQTLIGGNYGLIDKNTFTPNPDYYSALLWQQLMGENVLLVKSNASPYLRTYAHCSKGKPGVTLLLINLSNQTEFIIRVEDSLSRKKSQWRNWFVEWELSDGPLYREEYNLSPSDGNLRSKTMLLNGNRLDLTSDGEIPNLKPSSLDENSPISIAPHSIKFVALPNFDAPACA